jgi:glutaredoxin
MYRALPLTPRSILSTRIQIPAIKLARTPFPVRHRRVSPPLKRLAATATAAIVAMATTSSSPQQPSVAIITTQGCPYCRQAKADLTAAGIPYTEILITDQLDVLAEIKKATGQSTVPQVRESSRKRRTTALLVFLVFHVYP